MNFVGEVVTLKAGLTVPASALRLAIDLEARGITLRLDRDELVIRPASRVTADETALLRQHVAAIKVILRHSAPEVM